MDPECVPKLRNVEKQVLGSTLSGGCKPVSMMSLNSESRWLVSMVSPFRWRGSFGESQ